MRKNKRNNLITENLRIVDRLVDRFAIGNRFIKPQTRDDWKQDLRISVMQSVDTFLVDNKTRDYALTLQRIIYKHARTRLAEIASCWYRREGLLLSIDDVIGYTDTDPDVAASNRNQMMSIAEAQVRAAYPKASEAKIVKLTDKCYEELCRLPPPPAFPKSLSPPPDSPPGIVDGCGQVQIMVFSTCCAHHPYHEIEEIERQESRDRTEKVRKGFDALTIRRIEAAPAA